MKFIIGYGVNMKPAENTGKAPIPLFEDAPTSWEPGVELYRIPEYVAPMWKPGVKLDLSVYMSPSVRVPAFNRMPKESLVVEEKGFVFGDDAVPRDISASFPVPKEVQNNGTLWAHFFVARSGAVMDPESPKYDSSLAYHFTRPFTQYLPKKKIRKARNLLSGDGADGEDVDDAPTFSSYYHPNFTFSFVPDVVAHHYPSMHPAMRTFLHLESSGARDQSGHNGWYYPIMYVNTFWQLKNHMTEMNDTVKTLPLNVHLNTIKSWKFNILASVDEGMKINAAKAARGETVGPGADGAEFEQIKSILIDSNMYLLGITGVVSILHMIFETLAFKNDVQHWRKKKDNIGTSLRTILANVVMQLVIFLYLVDNNEHTSWMILVSQAIGIAIEAWKITKTVNVRVRPTAPGSMLPYSVVFEDKHKLSDVEKKTQEYDEIAFRYLYMVAVPLLLAYAGYSLVYDTHKSWYSFVIATLVGSVYAYGFLMMVPSLYINYRLKSVAHMPGKAMTYKFLNTFIDDLFAFTIKMPMLHRLATLRDDVIFFVYLYQMWKYKVDYTRVNEFGQGGDDEDEKTAEKMVEKAEEPAKVEGTPKKEGASTTAVAKEGGRKRK
jgi:hypothetical protein